MMIVLGRLVTREMVHGPHETWDQGAPGWVGAALLHFIRA